MEIFRLLFDSCCYKTIICNKTEIKIRRSHTGCLKEQLEVYIIHLCRRIAESSYPS